MQNKSSYISVNIRIGFITNIYIQQQKKCYLDDDGNAVKPKHLLQRGNRYTFGLDRLQEMWDSDEKIAREHFGRKIKSTGFIYLPGSKLREAEGHLMMGSCCY